MRTKASKAEIKKLFERVLLKYNANCPPAEKIKPESKNPHNYDRLTKIINKITKDFKTPTASLGHDDYKDEEDGRLHFTQDRIARAMSSGVNQPQKAMIDACYIYVFGKGRQGFIESPTDEEMANIIKANAETEEPKTTGPSRFRRKLFRNAVVYGFVTGGLLVLLLTAIGAYIYQCSVSDHLRNSLTRERAAWDTIKRDYGILRYHPSPAEIDSMTGIWICYSSSTQARPGIPEAQRYHSCARNFLEVQYHESGYFTFKRYSIGFDQVGYMQFESPGILSISSHKENKPVDSAIWPKRSLMVLDLHKNYHLAISASHNFDTIPHELIIGMREVYQKLGTGGHMYELVNDGSVMKRVVWVRPHKQPIKYKITLTTIEALSATTNLDLTDLLNEKSIILATPREDVIMTHPVQGAKIH